MSPSATLAMAAKARKMRAAGIDVISFATGEPDFDTPSFIKNSGKAGIDEGLTKYTPSSGIPELKTAIREKLARDNGLTYADDEIVVTCGAKQAIYNAIHVLAGTGDEVIVPAPYWVSYPEQVTLAGATPKFIATTQESAFKITPATLAKAITARTRAIILNTPSNPTGSAYSKEELAGLGAILTKRNIAIISDEIYEKLVYGDFKHASIAAACPDARGLTVVVNGVSKAYAMTGWRMGYAAGPEEIVSKMTILIEQQISCIPGFVQKACAAALGGSGAEMDEMRDEFSARRDLMYKLLSAIPGVSCHLPEGAFYLLPNVSAFIGRRFGTNEMSNATDIANYLLDEGRIATVSGDPFGAPGHIRFSYATSRENIEKGIARFGESLSKLK